MTYNYDPVTVASMNKLTSIETKIKALLSFLDEINWRKFVVIADSDYQSVSFVSSLREHVHPRNMRIMDWFVISADDTPKDVHYKFVSLQNGTKTFVLVTNKVSIAFNAFVGAGAAKIHDQSWVVVSDLDVRIFRHLIFPPNDVYSVTPKRTQEISLSAIVEDSVRSISYALKKRPKSKGDSCPRMKEMRR